MQTSSATHAPPEAPASVPTASPPKRRRRWLLVAGAAVAVGLICGVGTFWSNYDPLCADCGGVGGVLGPNVQRLGDFTSPRGDGFSAYRVTHVPGQTFSFWFTITNDGPVGVTITRIGTAPTPFEALSFVSVRISNQEGGTAPDRTRSFAPFSLPGRGAVDLLATVRMEGCYGQGAATGLAGIPVSFRLFGVTRHTTVYPDESIEVVGRAAEHCS